MQLSLLTRTKVLIFIGKRTRAVPVAEPGSPTFAHWGRRVEAWKGRSIKWWHTRRRLAEHNRQSGATKAAPRAGARAAEPERREPDRRDHDDRDRRDYADADRWVHTRLELHSEMKTVGHIWYFFALCVPKICIIWFVLALYSAHL